MPELDMGPMRELSVDVGGSMRSMECSFGNAPSPAADLRDSGEPVQARRGEGRGVGLNGGRHEGEGGMGWGLGGRGSEQYSRSYVAAAQRHR